MNTKELILKEIEQIPEPDLENFLKMVQSFRKNTARTFKGRPLLRPEDLNEKNFPYPPEPEWVKVWEELNE